jgi:hypothetical protein
MLFQTPYNEYEYTTTIDSPILFILFIVLIIFLLIILVKSTSGYDEHGMNSK